MSRKWSQDTQHIKPWVGCAATAEDLIGFQRAVGRFKKKKNSDIFPIIRCPVLMPTVSSNFLSCVGSPVAHFQQPHFCLAWIWQGVGSIPLRLWFMLIRFYHIMAAGLSLPFCYMPEVLCWSLLGEGTEALDILQDASLELCQTRPTGQRSWALLERWYLTVGLGALGDLSGGVGFFGWGKRCLDWPSQENSSYS